jgi:probable rRNA maturation factor
MTGELGQYQIEIQVDDSVSTQFELSGVDMTCIVTAVEATLRWHELDKGNVSVLITDDVQMQTFNRDYRGVDAPTDVLSFLQQAEPASAVDVAMPDELAEALGRQLGDLIIALPYTLHLAQHYGTSIDTELRLLSVHGTLHLLGYDHATPQEKAAMWESQDAVLRELGEAPHSDRDYD